MENHNSSINQEIKRKFIDREVLCLFSYPMEACLKAAAYGAEDMPDYGDIENSDSYPAYYGTYADFSGGSYYEREEEIKRLDSLYEGYSGEDDDKAASIHEEIEALEALEPESQEIYEWWIVTDYLLEKLREKGEPVIEWQNLSIWGRTTTGQAILLDHVISEICSDMEILEWQKYSWAEKQTV